MTDSDEEPKRKEKRQKGAGKSGFLAPLQLSDALVNFLGTGESELSRTDVIKRMWDYIKGNNLQVCHCSNLSYAIFMHTHTHICTYAYIHSYKALICFPTSVIMAMCI